MGDVFISIDELAGPIGTADAPRVFDVRRNEAYVADMRVLPPARWRAHAGIAGLARELSALEPVVVYCAYGHNVSQLAAAELRTSGLDARTLAGGIAAWRETGLPLLAKSNIPGRDETRSSVCVTRIRPKVDRVACPWLIRRFVDTSARFLFVAPDDVKDVAAELGGIDHDIEGVEFTHQGDGYTFDTMLERFGLEFEPLRALARIVRGADTGRLDLAPEAAGLLAFALGNAARAGGDDPAAVERGFPLYDTLYAWLCSARAEAHGWPPRS
jgi:rhodanese-related sulfurtransferase